MNLIPYSYNGHLINDGGTFTAKFPLNANNVYEMADGRLLHVSRTDNSPVYAGREQNAKTFGIAIQCKGDWSTQIDTLKQWFDTTQGEGTLIANNGSTQWQMVCVPEKVLQSSYPLLVMQMSAADRYWEKVIPSGGTFTATTTGSGTVTVGGNWYTDPTIVISPGGTVTEGYTYKRFITLYNRTARTYDHPIELTGGLDTSTLVSASKMQADGDDLRIYVDGTEVNRWLNGINSGTTTVWANLTLQPKQEMTLGGTIAASGAVGDITIANTTANITALKALQSKALSGIIQIDSELFFYDGVNPSTKKIAITSRAVNGSSAAGHSALATVRWIEHDIWMVYGNASATAPVTDDTRKPIFNLAGSSNYRWVYSEFADENGLQAGSWKPSLTRTIGKTSHIYTGTGGTVGVYPATAMGMEVDAWQYNATWKADSATMAWSIYHAAGIGTVTASGNKYRYSTSFPAFRYQSTSATDFITRFTEATPTNAGSVTPWTQSSVAIPGNPLYSRFYFNGSVLGTADNLAYVEINDMTIDFVSANTPVVAVGAEAGAYPMNCAFSNDTMGEAIALNYPVAVGGTITINTASKEADYNGQNIFPGLMFDSVRADWLRLQPGENVISYAQSGGGTVTVTLSWKDKNS